MDGTWQLQSYVPATVAWGRGIYDPKLEVDISFVPNSSVQLALTLCDFDFFRDLAQSETRTK